MLSARAGPSACIQQTAGMLLTIGTNLAWVLFLLVWGMLLMFDTKGYKAVLESADVSDDVTDSNI